MFKNILRKIKDFLQYRSEFILSKNIAYQILILALIAIAIAFITTIVLLISNVMPESWQNLQKSKLVWQNLMRVIDQGTMVNDEGSWTFLFIILATTVIGLILISALISIITQGLESSIDEFKKGRSKVVEKNHIVILGWSTKIYSIIDELIIGSKLSTRKGKISIAVLAEKSKTEMEDSIYDNCYHSQKANIICRSGNPIILEKLVKMSIHNAESVLVLASEDQNQDVFGFKIILAIIQLCRNETNLRLKNIVAEIFDNTYEKLLRKQLSNCSSNIKLISLNTTKIISQITAQTSIQKGLSKIYYELLSFSRKNNEIYIEEASKFISENIDLTFQDLTIRFKNACLIGFINSQTGKIIVNPLVNDKYNNYFIKEDDELIFIARRKKEAKCSEDHGNINNNENIPYHKVELPVENTIIFGVNEKLHYIVEEIDNYVEKKSETIIVSEKSDKEMKEYFNNKDIPLDKLKQVIRFTEYKSKSVDEKMLLSLEQNNFHNIVLLNQIDKNNEMKYNLSYLAQLEITDAKTIKSLLNIRHFFEPDSSKRADGFSIVSEMKFAHNKDLVPDGEFDEFIISDEIISLIIAQIILNSYRGNVYLQTLFSSDESEIYLKDFKYYISNKKSITFADLIEAGIQKKELIIGCVLNDKTLINPDKNKLIDFSKGDKVITLALDYSFEIIR